MINQRIIFLSLFVLFIQISPVFSQPPNPEIFLLSIEKKDGKLDFADGKNITNNLGYDKADLTELAFSLPASAVLIASSFASS